MCDVIGSGICDLIIFVRVKHESHIDHSMADHMTPKTAVKTRQT